MLTQIHLPGAAAQNFRDGDVRHFGPTDVFSSETVSQATRNLAYRDALLASKINEIVYSVNSAIINIFPINPGTLTLAAGEVSIVSRFRIPAGYEAKVISAALSCSTNTSGASLSIGYDDTGFGNIPTQTVITLVSGNEISGESAFFGKGEFTFALENLIGSTADINLSVLIGMRSVTA